MSERVYDAFEVCRAALATGVSLEAALGLYPDLADELRPALEAWRAASMLAPTPRVPNERRQRSRTRLLGRAAELRATAQRPRLAFGGIPRLAIASLTVMLVLLLGWGGLATASAQALPGDPLYRVKRTSENLRLGLSGVYKRSELETEYAERRSSEVRNLLALGRVQEIEFTGVLRTQAVLTWDIDGVQVHVGPETDVDTGVVPGVTVKVEGRTDSGGNVLADEIHLVGFTWEGRVESMGAQTWTVAGRAVTIGPATEISPGLRVGDRVLVLLDVSAGDGVHARSILYLGAGAPAPSSDGSGSGGSQEERTWEFEGLVQAAGAEAWIVAGQTLLVTPDTEIDSSLEIGQTARVKAQTTAQGRLIALKIERAEGGDGASDGGSDSGSSESGGSRPGGGSGSGGDGNPSDGATDGFGETQDKRSFTGQVTVISGSMWTIAGQQILVTGETELKDNPGLNDSVKVEARRVDGQWVAEKIEKQ